MIGEIERCIWIDWKEKIPSDIREKRIYFGHETCGNLLPDFKSLDHLVEFSIRENVSLTFVTPFLIERNFRRAVDLLVYLRSKVEEFEVVVSDMGLIDWICRERIGTPVISRFLVGQQVDFRLAGLLTKELSEDKFISIDDKLYRLKQKKISDDLKEHISSCSLLNYRTLEFFNKLGVFRFEISNVFQNFNLIQSDQNVFTLHVPLVPLSIMRWCTDENEDFNNVSIDCSRANCRNIRSEWYNEEENIDLLRVNNCLYYKNNDWEQKILLNLNINRIVVNNLNNS